MTRADILDSYQINDHGVIQTPGKFEAEPLYTPYFWECALDGSAETISGPDDVTYTVVEITPADRAEFPEIDATIVYVVLYERESGFVDLAEYTAADYNIWLTAIESAVEMDQEDESTDSEPQEDDITTEDHQHFYQNGRLVFEGPNANGDWFITTGNTSHPYIGRFGDDHVAAIRAYMDKTQYFPNCWFISDHGNAHLMDLNSK